MSYICCKMKSEDRIQQEIVTWMWNEYPRTRRCMFHVPNEGKRSKLEAIRLKNMGVISGTPDLILAWCGYIFGFEVKTETGVQSKTQKEIEQVYNKAGNPYFIVRSLEQFIPIARWIMDTVIEPADILIFPATTSSPTKFLNQ